MPRRRIPKYRRFKPKNLGLVVIDGKQHYLGRYGSPESVAEYNRLIQEWLAREPLTRTEPGPDMAEEHLTQTNLAEEQATDGPINGVVEMAELSVPPPALAPRIASAALRDFRRRRLLRRRVFAGALAASVLIALAVRSSLTPSGQPPVDRELVRVSTPPATTSPRPSLSGSLAVAVTMPLALLTAFVGLAYHHERRHYERHVGAGKGGSVSSVIGE